MIEIKPPYQKVELTLSGPQSVKAILRDGSTRFIPLTPELQELFGEKDHLYFEAIVSGPVIDLRKNVSPHA